MQQASKETTRKLASVQVINKIEELNKMKTLLMQSANKENPMDGWIPEVRIELSIIK